MRVEGKNFGVKIGEKNIDNIRFPDGTTIVSTSNNSLMKFLETVSDSSAQRGLLLNTKVMGIDRGRNDFTDFPHKYPG